MNRRAVVEHEIALLILRVAGAGHPAVWWLIGIGVVDALFGVVALMMHGRLHRSAPRPSSWLRGHWPTRVPALGRGIPRLVSV